MLLHINLQQNKNTILEKRIVERQSSFHRKGTLSYTANIHIVFKVKIILQRFRVYQKTA